MVTASTDVQTDLLKVVHPSCRPICHSSEPQTPTVRISSPRPICLGDRCSEHKLVRSHCLCLLSYSSPSQGDPEKVQLPHHSNSSRLTRDVQVWDLVQLSIEIQLRLPVSTTLLKQSHNQVFHNNPHYLNLQPWYLEVDNAKNTASLWK